MRRFGFGFGFGRKKITELKLSIRLWLDNGTSAINTPWNDLDTWSE